MCEPGSPAKRYGGVHTTGGEYKTILSSVWLSPASVQPAGRRRSLLPTLLTRRPQSAAPAPAPAAVLPRPPSRGRRRRRRPGRARACAPTDPVTAAEASSLGRHTHSQNPKGVPKARRGDYGHANIKPAIGGYYYGDYIATHNAPRLALQCLVSRRARGSQPQALDRHGHDATDSNSFTCIAGGRGPPKGTPCMQQKSRAHLDSGSSDVLMPHARGRARIQVHTRHRSFARRTTLPLSNDKPQYPRHAREHSMFSISTGALEPGLVQVHVSKWTCILRVHLAVLISPYISHQCRV